MKLTFPNPVDEVSARLVAGGVLVMGAVALATGSRVVLAVLAYGFVARVLAGPTLSPLGRLVTQVVRPRLPVAPRPVPGPPKRFAQGVGAACTVTALLLAWSHHPTGAAAILVLLLVFATLESVFAWCAGCVVFGWLMRVGIVPEDVCVACNDLRLRKS
jgi:hypothetical protein